MVSDAVVDGGFVCVNIGDATRTIDGSFQLFPNTAQVIETFRELGFHVLPRIYWQKPTNSTTAFLGSGTLPPNAYPKLEHEHILVFRKGDSKTFEPKADRRYQAAYFYEERNQWFSDQWDDVGGASQEFSVVSEDGEDTDSTIPRERTGAFPVEIPYRLINMFTVYGDVVCDPFIGTGTTSLAAMLTGRHSIGIEIESGIAELLSDRVRGIVTESQERITERIAAHQEFVQDRADNGNPASYEASHYPFSVVTKQEKQVKFYEVVDCAAISESNCERFISLPDSSVPVGYRVTYKPYGEDIPVRLDRYS
jgi:DNA modification methylase